MLLIELDEHIESFTKSGESEISVQILISSFDLNLFNLKSLDFFKCEITNEPIINLFAINKSGVSLVRVFSSVGNIGDTRESGIVRNEEDVILGNLNIQFKEISTSINSSSECFKSVFREERGVSSVSNNQRSISSDSVIPASVVGNLNTKGR